MPNPPRKSTPDAYVHNLALRDEQFLEEFLGSPEFLDVTLRRLIPRRKGKKKTGKKKKELASILAEEIARGRVSTSDVLLAWAKQPRRWLTFTLGHHEPAGDQEFPSADILLNKFRPAEQGWFGPIEDDETGLWYFVKPMWIKNWEYHPDSAPVLKPIRWHIFAEVGDKHIALTWNNFTRSAKQDSYSQTQWPYWKCVAPSFDTFLQQWGGTWKQPEMNQVVLHQLWDDYADDPVKNWIPERVRGSSRGVTVILRGSSGRMGGGAKEEMKGLKTLAEALAAASLQGAGVTFDEAAKKKADRATLRTLIHRWDPAAFEFILNAREGAKLKKNDLIARAHCFFGNGQKRTSIDSSESILKEDTPQVGADLSMDFDDYMTQDCLMHIECYHAYGYSDGTLDFFLDELGVPRWSD